MSWLSIPLPNPFKSLQNNDNDDEEDNHPQNDVVSSSAIGRQCRAIISPEPSNSGEVGGPPPSSSSSRTLEGIRSDLEEIKGTFKSSLSIFSSNKAVSEISKLASNLLKFNDESDVDFVNNNVNFRRNNNNNNNNNNNYNNVNNNNNDNDDDDDDDEDEVVGINDEVVEFAQQISKRPELWIEFPLSLNHEFDMSEAQYEHASVIEQLVPSLADLRSNVSSDKSENQFWMIYFILLLPRLSGEDLELLSTPEIVEARATLLKMLQAKKSEINSENLQSDSSYDSEHEVRNTAASTSQSSYNVMISENSNAPSSQENESNNKKLSETKEWSSFTSDDPNPKSKPENINSGFGTEKLGTVDSRKNKENPAMLKNSVAAQKQIQSEDDMSFSDLDDDDLHNRQLNSGPLQFKRISSPEGSNDWVRLNRMGMGGSKVSSQSSLRERDSEGEDSTGWLTVDDFDS